MIKFYDIDPSYIEYLKNFDKQIPDIKYDKSNKFVCGVVFSMNDIDYYAPISHYNIKQQTNFPIYKKDKIISTVRFCFMFPAFNDVLTLKSFKDVSEIDVKYANLLQSEYEYCKQHEFELVQKAKQVYNIGCNKKHRLNYTCCDFKLLENKCLEYQAIKEQEVALAEVAVSKIED